MRTYWSVLMCIASLACVFAASITTENLLLKYVSGIVTNNDVVFMKYHISQLYSTASVDDIKLSIMPTLIEFEIHSSKATIPVDYATKAFNLQGKFQRHIRRLSGIVLTTASKSRLDTCFNGVKDGIEVDVDCGGSDCPQCNAKQVCKSNTDCISLTCSNTIVGSYCNELDASPFYSVSLHSSGVSSTNTPITYTIETYAIPPVPASSSVIFDLYPLKVLGNTSVACADSANSVTIVAGDTTLITYNRQISLVSQPVTCTLTTAAYSVAATSVPVFFRPDDRIIIRNDFKSTPVVGDYGLDMSISQVTSWNTQITYEFNVTASVAMTNALVSFERWYTYTPIKCTTGGVDLVTTESGPHSTISITVPTVQPHVAVNIVCLTKTPYKNTQSQTITAYLSNVDPVSSVAQVVASSQYKRAGTVDTVQVLECSFTYTGGSQHRFRNPTLKHTVLQFIRYQVMDIWGIASVDDVHIYRHDAINNQYTLTIKALRTLATNPVVDINHPLFVLLGRRLDAHFPTYMVKLLSAQVGTVQTHCFNDVTDGDETDLNCGGASCSVCLQGQTCELNTDCESNMCTARTLISNCEDPDPSDFRSLILLVDGLDPVSNTHSYHLEFNAVPDIPNTGETLASFIASLLSHDMYLSEAVCMDVISNNQGVVYEGEYGVSLVHYNRPIDYKHSPITCKLSLPDFDLSNMTLDVTGSFKNADGTYGYSLKQIAMPAIPVEHEFFRATLEKIESFNTPMNIYFDLRSTTVPLPAILQFGITYELDISQITCIDYNGTPLHVKFGSHLSVFVNLTRPITLVPQIITCTLPTPPTAALYPNLMYSFVQILGVDSWGGQSMTTRAESIAARLPLKENIMTHQFMIKLNGTDRFTERETEFIRMKYAEYFSLQHEDFIPTLFRSNYLDSSLVLQFDVPADKIQMPYPPLSATKPLRLQVQAHFSRFVNLVFNFTYQTETIAKMCFDKTMNGLETDVDCGGPECPACQTDKLCLSNTDCFSGRCLGSETLRCIALDQTPFISTVLIVDAVTSPQSPIRYTFYVNALPSLDPGYILTLDYSVTQITTESSSNTCKDESGDDAHLVITPNGAMTHITINRAINQAKRAIICTFTTPVSDVLALTLRPVLTSPTTGKVVSQSAVSTHPVKSTSTLVMTIPQVKSMNTPIEYTFTIASSVNPVSPRVVFDLNYTPNTPVKCHDATHTYDEVGDIELQYNAETHEYVIVIKVPISATSFVITCLVVTPSTVSPSSAIQGRFMDGMTELRTHTIYSAAIVDTYSIPVVNVFKAEIHPTLPVNSVIPITFVFSLSHLNEKTFIEFNTAQASLTYFSCDSLTMLPSSINHLSYNHPGDEMFRVDLKSQSGIFVCSFKTPSHVQSHPVYLTLNLKRASDNSTILTYPITYSIVL